MGTTLDKLANRSFILLRAEWSVAKSVNLVTHVDATHVIVREPSLYFLFQIQEFLALVETHRESETLGTALRLAHRRTTPVFEGSKTREDVSARCVIIEDGNLIGFFDSTYRPRVMRGARRNLKPPDSTSTASLVAELPERIVIGETVSLLVHISPGFTHDALPIPLAKGEVVDVVIQTKLGFLLEERGEGRLTVSGEIETLPLQFKLKAVTEGLGLVRVLAFHKGQPLGVVSVSPNVVKAGTGVTVAQLSNDQPVAPVTVRSPDLSLLILEETVNGAPAISLWLTAADARLGLNFKKYGPVSLRVDPFRYFQEFFKDIESLRLGSAKENSIAQARMAAKGTTLFETLIPENLRADIWKLRGNIISVEVQSEEPWVPWELCKMSGEEDGRVVEGPFFAEAFNITRWLPGVPRKPKLSLQNVGVVVPQNSGLRYAQAERDYMLSLSTGGQITTIPATFLDVRTALASGDYDGLHFSGHGIFRDADPNRSAIILEQGGDLTPEDLSGVVRNLGRSHPIVFLNACQIGRAGMSLTDVGGWASHFLRAGAGAFIGAYWSVYDKPAYDFAQAFYNRLLQGTPIGEAARQARLATRPEGDPTWLAYTVFADPLATLSGNS